MNSEFGILYLIPCPISDETAPWDVLPAANRAVMDALDYFIVENTRTARRFLSKACIARPIGELEFRELNEHTAAGREIEELIAARQQARKEKNFARADEIRQQLLDMGIILEDTREGVKWKRA